MQLGALFEHPSTTATDDRPHTLSYATARSTTGHRLLDIWNGPTNSSRVFSVDKDGNAIVNKLYLGSDTNTFFELVSADRVRLQAGGAHFLDLDQPNSRGRLYGTFAVTKATGRLYLDADGTDVFGGDTYLAEGSANRIDIVVGGTTFAQLGSAVFSVTNAHFSIPAGNKLHLDGGGDTYLIESSANVIKAFASNVEVAQLTAPSTNTTSLALRVDRASVVTAGNVVKIGGTGTGPGGTGRALYIDD